MRRTEAVAELLPQLYLHGLAQGDFELALRGLLGEGAPLSAASIERLRAKWTQEYAAWRTQRLEQLEVVYAWADGLYVKAGLEDTKAALLVIIGALKDGRKVVLAVESDATCVLGRIVPPRARPQSSSRGFPSTPRCRVGRRSTSA